MRVEVLAYMIRIIYLYLIKLQLKVKELNK